MDAGSLLANRQARGDGQGQANGLDQKRARAEKTFHDEAGDDTFDFGDARAGGVRRKGLD